MNKEDWKSLDIIKNKWFETKDDYLDMALNIFDKVYRENKELKEIIESIYNGTRPIISPYHDDAYISQEMEYVARKVYQERIDKAVDIISNDTTLNPHRQRERLINILKGDK